MYLEDVLQEFLLDCQLRQLSPRTIRHNRNSNKKMFRFFQIEYGVETLERVKTVYIKGYIQHLMELGCKETYINGLIKSFRAFFKYCMKEEYIRENPVLKVEFQKEEMPLILTFSDDEVVQMMKYYSGRSFLELRNKLILTILFDTGIRNSELCDIQIDDLRGNAINIRGKGKKQRYVPLTPAIQKCLLKYIRSREFYIKDKQRYEIQYLLLSQKGKKLTKETIERVVRKCGEECNIRKEIRCSPHTCRHYYAQKQLRNKCDVFVVSKLLGHGNLSITKRYLNSIQDDEIIKLGTATSPLLSLGIRG